ncbi:hypothetical protein IQ266_18975 [filamentous cyanobacterium LEGE 11480]|uniref:Uncharacterized protein n=1 Tax=Romeriopsis navalis LEGE 11480 TaxID=2777977 RepID=A0A928VSN8_9CYAN|nr:hypothetical protein [Romeriopsis navalis]MBE9031822.1 hypothetical protein [Romeriopsis navalis LEGE 11480]
MEKLHHSQRHGHRINGKSSPTYVSWLSMHDRLNRTTCNGYENYGGKGIKVCDEWESFEAFLQDMGERPNGKTLDRIDHSGDYCPANCRWATAHEQARNRSNNRWISFQGKRRILADWATELGLTGSALARRLDMWPIERALTTPNMRGAV